MTENQIADYIDPDTGEVFQLAELSLPFNRQLKT
jgi:hypothetical protein